LHFVHFKNVINFGMYLPNKINHIWSFITSYILIHLSVYLTRQFWCNSMVESASAFSMVELGNALRLSVMGPDVEADRAQRGGWGRERSVCPSICDGSGWTGHGWLGGGPRPWSVNTADEETGSPRRKGGPGQLSSVKKDRWSRTWQVSVTRLGKRVWVAGRGTRTVMHEHGRRRNG
jgi:hypothetical protein